MDRDEIHYFTENRKKKIPIKEEDIIAMKYEEHLIPKSLYPRDLMLVLSAFFINKIIMLTFNPTENTRKIRSHILAFTFGLTYNSVFNVILIHYCFQFS